MVKQTIMLMCLLAIVASGCNTKKHFQKQIGKALVLYPEILDTICVEKVVIKESEKIETKYMQGKTDTIEKVIEVDCKEVGPMQVFTNNFHTRDTVFQTTEIIKENNKKLDMANAKIAVKDSLIAQQDVELSATKKTIRIGAIIAIAIIAIQSMIIYLKR